MLASTMQFMKSLFLFVSAAATACAEAHDQGHTSDHAPCLGPVEPAAVQARSAGPTTAVLGYFSGHRPATPHGPPLSGPAFPRPAAGRNPRPAAETAHSSGEHDDGPGHCGWGRGTSGLWPLLAPVGVCRPARGG